MESRVTLRYDAISCARTGEYCARSGSTTCPVTQLDRGRAAALRTALRETGRMLSAGAVEFVFGSTASVPDHVPAHHSIPDSWRVR